MTIQINEHGSDRYYKEIANVYSQYSKLLKKPDRKIKNCFLRQILMIVYCSAGICLSLAMSRYLGSDGLRYCAVLFGVALICSVGFLFVRRRLYLRVKNEFSPSVLTLDENGVELKKEGQNSIRAEWSSVLFVRELPEEVLIVLSSPMNFAIHVGRPHCDQMVDYIRKNKPLVWLITL